VTDVTTRPDADVFARLRPFLGGIFADRGRAERFGSLVLYVREGAGHPFYATLAPDATAPTAAELTADLAVVRARQRELGVPESFEWVHENAPELAGIAQRAGLSVHRAPLLVLDTATAPAALPAGIRLVTLDPADPSFGELLATGYAVADVGFGHAGTAAGEAGPAERDAARRPVDAVALDQEVALVRAGRHTRILAVDAALGAVAIGSLQRLGGVAEIAGVATLPAARRRGLAAAVTAELARVATTAGSDLIYISADSDDVARIYRRQGFRRVGASCIASSEPA
jgi:ribosomal protein S18 acetylase RimI-like enzyme